MEFATDLRFPVDMLRHALMLNRPRLIMCDGFRSKALLMCAAEARESSNRGNEDVRET